MSAVETLSSYDNKGLRQINLGNGVGATDAVTKGQLDSASSTLQSYVDSQLAGVVSGLTSKGAVRVAVGTNVNLAAPGTTLDGVAMNVGDRFLAYGQTTGAQNGPFVYNGAAAAATRAPNWDTQAEAVTGSQWVVLEGTRADTLALLTNDTFTLDATTATFGFFSLSATGNVVYTEVNPDTSAGGSWIVTHNLGTRSLFCQVARAISPYDYVNVRIERTSINTVTVQPDVPITAGQFEIIIRKAV